MNIAGAFTDTVNPPLSFLIILISSGFPFTDAVCYALTYVSKSSMIKCMSSTAQALWCCMPLLGPCKTSERSGHLLWGGPHQQSITRETKYIARSLMSCVDWALLLLSRFSRVRVCATLDRSPPGSPVPGILQARTLEWVAISFSNA